MVEKEDLLIFKMREKKRVETGGAQAAQTQVQQMVQEEAVEQPKPEAMEAAKPSSQPSQAEIAATAQPAEEAPKRKAKGAKGEKEKEMEAAKGLFCEWHPWRPAYAVCSTCHKPYCYEDMSEYNDRYYCLEDIDAATVNAKPRTTFGYNKNSLLSATMFMLTMLVYIYFINGQLYYTIKSALDVGVSTFVRNNLIISANYFYINLFAGLTILVLVFISGVLIFMQSRKGYWLSILFGSASFIFFSYLYLSNFKFYGFVVSALTLIGLVSLRYAIHSKTTEEQAPAPPPVSGPTGIEWPAAGRF